MHLILGSVAALLLGGGVMMIGNALLAMLVPLRMDDLGFSTEIVGLIGAGYFAGLLLGSIFAKKIIFRVGHIRSFAAFAGLMAAASLIHPLFVEPATWTASRIVYGFSMAGIYAVLESWLNERSTNETRGRILGVYQTVVLLGLILGQLFVSLYELESASGFIVAALLTSLSLVPVVLTKVEAPNLEAVRPMRLGELIGVSPVACVGTGMSGMMLGAYFGMGPVFGRELDLELLEISLFMGSVVLGGLLLQWPIGRLSDRFDRRTILLIALVLTGALSAFGITVERWADPLYPLMTMGFALGGVLFSLYPISISQAYDYITADRYVAASSGLLLIYSVGAVLGPIICAAAMGQFGAPAFFAFLAVSAILLAVFVVYRMRARSALPPDQQEPFVPLAPVMASTIELDPRAEVSDEGEARPASAATETTEGPSR